MAQTWWEAGLSWSPGNLILIGLPHSVQPFRFFLTSLVLPTMATGSNQQLSKLPQDIGMVSTRSE